MELLTPSDNTEQPPLYSLQERNELTVVVASLSLGGAERIVLDWATRIHPRWHAHLIVLRDRNKEWPVPSHIKVTRVESDARFLTGPKSVSKHNRRLYVLQMLGAEIAQSVIPVCIAHLLREDERTALGMHGATIINVLHNAKHGWNEDVSHLDAAINTIAVSDACVSDLRDLGFAGSVSVIRHIPPRRIFATDTREQFRSQWKIPQDALVIGMVGAVKAQKNYGRALRIFKSFLQKRDAYLVIVGGPVNILEEGRRMWEALVSDIDQLDLRMRVAMPGFIPDAAQCLPAFDVVLNTSDFEGMSIATLEALQSGLPIVASKVGGQGEVSSSGLTLIDANASDQAWVDALTTRIGQRFEPPAWSKFPSYRLWTLASLARPVLDCGKTLFVTANLNSGGAQRSLVNLATHIVGCANFEIIVNGNSSHPYFYRRLRAAGVRVQRSGDTFNAFDHAEVLVHKICAEDIGTVCFWNVDHKVKLLLVKALGWTKVRFIDVSPGGYAFDEMDETTSFQRFAAYTSEEYYRRLDTLILKYDGPYPAECEGKVLVIRNGVSFPVHTKSRYEIGSAPKVVMNGRIAPSKFLEEIIEAMQMLRESIPNVELHIFGGAEECEQQYFEKITATAQKKLGTGVRFYGANFETISQIAQFDAYVVLGKHQGCPNALLEALAVGLPCVANNDGGTREQVIDGVTGLLVSSTNPASVAFALKRILSNRNLAKRLGRAGRSHVEKHFSMREMTEKYLQLFAQAPSGEAQMQRAVE